MTELVTGVDLVREQLRVAAGEPLSRDRPGRAARSRDRGADQRRRSRREAFSRCRAGSSASEPPLGPGVRVDTHVEDGAVVPPYYDSLLGKVIAWDEDRPSAIARALRALAEAEVRGVPTTFRSRSTSCAARSSRPAATRPASWPRWARTAGAGGELMSGRRAARRTALFLLYQWDVTAPAARVALRGRGRPVRA